MDDMFSQASRCLAITKKDIRIYYLRGPVIIFGILIPLFFFFAYSVGRNIPKEFLFSGLLGITLFFGSTSVSPMIFPWEARMKTLERLISSPLLIETILLGDMLASFIFGITITTIPLLVGMVVGLNISSFLVLILGIVLAGLCFSALGLLFSVPPSSMPSSIMLLSNLVKFPLLFISGIIIPLEKMPVWGRTLASISPLTYFVDLMRGTFQGANYYSIFHNLISLILFSIAFLAIAIIGHKRTLEKRLYS